METPNGEASEEGSQSPDALLSRLREIQPGESAQLVAALWTWLDQHLLALGSLREKAPVIRARALGQPFEELAEEDLEQISEDPLFAAALLLSRIHHHLAAQAMPPVAEDAVGIDGRAVVVVWRAPALAQRLRPGSDEPPPAIEHPALAALAPRLAVSPVSLSGIRVRVGPPDGGDEEDWLRVMTELRSCLGDDDTPLHIHLDTLGSSGLPKLEWTVLSEEPAAGVGWFAPDENTEGEAADAVRAAVAEASGPDPSILVLPELALSDASVAALKSALEELDDRDQGPPVLTVAGCLHRPLEAGSVEAAVDEELRGTAQLAGHVNEALILGPGGQELWRHRKISSAQAPVSHDGVEMTLVEDIQLGNELRVVPTPLGHLAVVICLDAFAAHVRDRLVASPADLLLIPSLSRRVHRHRSSLNELVQKLWGAAFVCNRWPPEDERTGWNEDSNRSFWAIQRQEPQIPPPKEPGEHPSFVLSTAP